MFRSSVQSRSNGEHPAADVCPSAETNAQTISTMSVEGLASRLDDLKDKEKNLASKDRRLRELQKKLSVKEINLGILWTVWSTQKCLYHSWKIK